MLPFQDYSSRKNFWRISTLAFFYPRFFAPRGRQSEESNPRGLQSEEIKPRRAKSSKKLLEVINSRGIQFISRTEFPRGFYSRNLLLEDKIPQICLLEESNSILEAGSRGSQAYFI